jgi:uncharacterized protein DUF4129
MMRSMRCIAVGLVALLAMSFMPWGATQAAPSPTDPAQVRAEVERVYDWSGYQRDLPGERPARPAEPPTDVPVLDLGPLLQAILVGLVVIAIVGAAMWLQSGGWRWLAAPRRAEREEEAPAEVSRERLKARLGDADRSAVSGDWASAIHILLLTSIDLLRRRVGQDVPPAMTARALVGRAQVEASARADFAALVAAAELCHFGGRPADRPLYERCRQHYERLWGMPPEQTA